MTQNTLKDKVRFSGVGIHTGQASTVTVNPAPENSGRRFLVAGTEIPARVDFVRNCDRSTILGKEQATVHTPEHLLAALTAFDIDNALIELEGPEIPIMDGAAAEFCRAFQEIGLEAQKAPAKVLAPDRPWSVRRDNGALVVVTPAASAAYEYALFYDHPMIGYQNVVFRPDEDDFATELAPARTFALWEEVKPLIERGMGQGGHADNCLVIFQDHFSTPLKVECEPVRHKCLDLLGDFALLDARLQARVLAVKAGHALHVDCAKKVWEALSIAHECA